MFMKYIVLGFFVKFITGLDDAVTRIPVLASVTRTWYGRVIFSLGNLFAVFFAISVSTVFGSFLHTFSYYRYISAGLLFLLAITIYFDVFVHIPRAKAEKKIQEWSIDRHVKIFGVGFVASLATLIDDVIAYSPLLSVSFWNSTYAIIGIVSATVLQIILVVFFAHQIKRLKYKEEIASIGLVILGILIISGVV